jgi:hypothetical protein
VNSGATVAPLQLFVMEWRRHITTIEPLCTCKSITLKIAAIAAETCWWEDCE